MKPIDKFKEAFDKLKCPNCHWVGMDLWECSYGVRGDSACMIIDYYDCPNYKLKNV